MKCVTSQALLVMGYTFFGITSLLVYSFISEVSQNLRLIFVREHLQSVPLISNKIIETHNLIVNSKMSWLIISNLDFPDATE